MGYVTTAELPPIDEVKLFTPEVYREVTIQTFRERHGPNDRLRVSFCERLYGENVRTWVARRVEEGVLGDSPLSGAGPATPLEARDGEDSWTSLPAETEGNGSYNDDEGAIPE